MRQIKISYNITNRDSEGLEKYLVDISREPMVSVEEETELAHKISLGGPEGEKARDRLVKANLRFVVSVDNSDLTETVQMVKDVAPALSPECIGSLLELVNGGDAKAGDNEWDELRQALEAALPTTEKRNDENIP